MQSTSNASLPSSCYPIPKPVNLHRSHLKKIPVSLSFPNTQSHFENTCSLTLPATHNCSSKERGNSPKKNNNSCPHQNHTFFDQFYSPTDTNNGTSQNPGALNRDQEEERQTEGDDKVKSFKVHFTNMWWADWKAALGQRINLEGIVSSAVVFAKDRHLALPHVAVPDVRYIDWAELRRRGFKGVVFDKDNTITAPYSLKLWAPLGPSLDRCKSVFGHGIAVFSNSAGLYEYDHDGSKARALEGAIGIKVIRHTVKKPAGTAEEIEKHFGCESSELIMVGDRPFTDIVYGNRNGFLTILTEPLSLAEEPFIVRQVRRLEVSLVNSWFRRGLKPISHNLLPDVMQCVEDPPPL